MPFLRACLQSGLFLLLAGCCLMRSSSPILVWNCSRDGLAPVLLRDLDAAMADYAEATGDEAVVVTSGRRTLRRQAELMADFSQDQLVGLYGRHGMPCYVQSIGEFRQREGRDPNADEVYEILRTRESGYISDHLYGGAVDIASSSVQNIAALRTCLQEHGFRVLDERDQGIACLHASHTGVPRLIARD